MLLQPVLHAATAAALVTTLAGCAGGAEGMLDDYVGRVANVLDAEPPPLKPIDLPAYPRPRELRQQPPEIRLNLVDAWALRGCEVFTLVGERNSILGRVADPVIRLDYERRLLTLLPRCLEKDIELPDDLRAELEDALAQKRASFDQHLWNATLANPDYSSYWTDGSSPFAPDDTLDVDGYAANQRHLAELVAEPLATDQDDWLSALEDTAQYPMGGHSLQSMRLAMQYLEQAEAMLAEAAEDQRLCPQGNTLTELDYARNVMTNYFAGEIQPWLGTVDQRFLAGYQPLVAMADNLSIDAPVMASYLEELEAWHEAYRQAIREQVVAWKRVFEVCGGRAVG